MAKIARIPPSFGLANGPGGHAHPSTGISRCWYSGRNRAIETLVSAVRTARSGLRDPNRPGRLLPSRRSDRSRQDGSDTPARDPPRRGAGSLRHVRIHGAAHRLAPHRGPRPDTWGSIRADCSPRQSTSTRTRCSSSTKSRRHTPDVFNILLQVMDHGTLTDNNGRKADFRNVAVVMTTNAGAEQRHRRSMGFTTQDHSPDAMEAISRTFSPEFRNRLDAVVEFDQLERSIIGRIVDKFILELETQLEERRVTPGTERSRPGVALGERIRPDDGCPSPWRGSSRRASSVRSRTNCCSET